MPDLLDPVAPPAPAAPRQRAPDLLDLARPNSSSNALSELNQGVTPVSATKTAIDPARVNSSSNTPVAVPPQQPTATQQPPVDLLSPAMPTGAVQKLASPDPGPTLNFRETPSYQQAIYGDGPTVEEIHRQRIVSDSNPDPNYPDAPQAKPTLGPMAQLAQFGEAIKGAAALGDERDQQRQDQADYEAAGRKVDSLRPAADASRQWIDQNDPRRTGLHVAYGHQENIDKLSAAQREQDAVVERMAGRSRGAIPLSLLPSVDPSNVGADAARAYRFQEQRARGMRFVQVPDGAITTVPELGGVWDALHKPNHPNADRVYDLGPGKDVLVDASLLPPGAVEKYGLPVGNNELENIKNQIGNKISQGTANAVQGLRGAGAAALGELTDVNGPSRKAEMRAKGETVWSDEFNRTAGEVGQDIRQRSAAMAEFEQTYPVQSYAGKQVVQAGGSLPVLLAAMLGPEAAPLIFGLSSAGESYAGSANRNEDQATSAGRSILSFLGNALLMKLAPVVGREQAGTLAQQTVHGLAHGEGVMYSADVLNQAVAKAGTDEKIDLVEPIITSLVQSGFFQIPGMAALMHQAGGKTAEWLKRTPDTGTFDLADQQRAQSAPNRDVNYQPGPRNEYPGVDTGNTGKRVLEMQPTGAGRDALQATPDDLLSPAQANDANLSQGRETPPVAQVPGEKVAQGETVPPEVQAELDARGKAPAPQSGAAKPETATDTSGVGKTQGASSGEPGIAPVGEKGGEQTPPSIDLQPPAPERTAQPQTAQPPPAQRIPPGDGGETAPKSSAQSGVTAEPAPDVTSIKNAQTAKERTAAGLPERVKPPTQGFDPVWKEAVRRIEADPNASRDLIAKLKANPEMAANQFEQDMVLHRRLELANEVKRLTRERNAAREAGDPVKAEQLGAELAKSQDQYKEALEIGERIGTTGGRTLSGRRKYVDTLTYDLAHMIASEEGAKGRKLTAPERDQVEALHKKIEETEAAHAEALAGRDARIAELESQRDHAEKVKQKPAVTREPSTSMKYGSRNRLVTREAYEKTLGELRNATFSIETIAAKAVKLATFHVEAGARTFAEFSKRMIADVGAKIGPHLNALYKKAVAAVGPDYRDRVLEGMKGKLDEDAGADVTRYIGELHKSFIAEQLAKDGKSTRDASLESVHNAIKDLMPEGWTKSDTRDAMSGRGKTVEMSQDEVSVARRKEKGELLALGHLEGLAKTPPEAPPHTGLQRDKPGTEKRQLDKKVRDEMARLGVNVTDPETQLAGVMDSIKTRLKNEIDDLDLQITTGQRSDDTRTPIEYDAEAKDLKAQRDAKKKTLDELFPATPEEQAARALKMAESQAKQAEKRLEAAKAGNFKKPDGTRITGPEIEAMRDRADAANKEAAALRALDLDVREARQVKDLESRIAKLQAGETKDKTIQPPDTAKVAELRAELEKLQAARATPKRTPEEIAIAVRRAAKSRAIADYSDRLARGDFAPKTRPDRTETDPGTLRLAKIADDAKQQWLRRQRQHELANRSTVQKVWDGFKETLNVPRMIMTSMDVSAVLRQGAVIAFGHPVRAAKAIGPMMRSLVSEQAAFNVMHDIENRPNAPLYDKSKLYLAKRDEGMNVQEEAFMSRLAGKIPGIKQSERAYTTFLNKLRADSFDAMLANLSKDGRTPTHEEAMAVANYVNIATGRGKVGGFEHAAQGLNTFFFAARNLASRFQLIAGQPFYGGNAKTRGLIAKEYGRFLIGAGVVYVLGAAAGGTVEKDPRSSDFGKIKFGNTRMDPLAGLSQVSVLLSRLATGETKSASGLVSPIRGPAVTYGHDDASGLIGRFLRSKLAPVPSAVLNLATGKDVVGNKVTVGGTIAGMMTPLVGSDIYAAMKDQGVPRGAALSLLTLFGMSMQTYPDNGEPNPKGIAKQEKKIKGAEFRGELPEKIQKLLSEHNKLNAAGVQNLSDPQKQRRAKLARLVAIYKGVQLWRDKGDKKELETRMNDLKAEADRLEGP